MPGFFMVSFDLKKAINLNTAQFMFPHLIISVSYVPLKKIVTVNPQLVKIYS
jgi:hypothetical protein